MKKVEATHSKGHYSAATIQNGFIFVAGQLPIDYEAGETSPRGGIEEQTKIALKNVASVLERCGSNVTKVLKTTVFISDIGDWSAVNTIYSEFFGEHKPARTIVPIGNLHYGCLIEIEAIACTSEEG